MKIKDKIRARRLELALTLEEVANKVGVAKSTVKKWESGQIESMRQSKIVALANALQVDVNYLIFEDETQTNSSTFSALGLSSFDNIFPVTKHKIPILGEIACGTPIYASEDRESYIESGTDMQADFCLKCKGDSMIGARIHNGDIVFIKKQSIVDNGEIAAVIIDNEATLKRVYYYPEKQKLVLQAENPSFEPLVYIGDELNEITILGKAIAFQSDVK